MRATDTNHGLRHTSTFGGATLDGPALYGYSDGVLGTTNGGERGALYWDKNGRVGINTETSTDGQLHIDGNIAFQKSTDVIIGFPDDYKGNAGHLTLQARNAEFDGGCHRGANLNLFAGHRNSAGGACDSGGNVRLRAGGNTFSTNGHGQILFETQNGTTPIERMRINDLGDVGIGTGSPTSLLSVNGQASKPGGGGWATFSDRRLKKDIQPYQAAIDVLNKVEPITYRYNGKGGIADDSTRFVGIIAQELREIAPHMVDTVQMMDADSVLRDYLSVDHNAFTFMLINATQEQQERIDAQAQEIERLKQDNVTLKARLQRIEAYLQLDSSLEKAPSAQPQAPKRTPSLDAALPNQD